MFREILCLQEYESLLWPIRSGKNTAPFPPLQQDLPTDLTNRKCKAPSHDTLKADALTSKLLGNRQIRESELSIFPCCITNLTAGIAKSIKYKTQ